MPFNILPGLSNDHCQFAFVIDLPRGDFGNDDGITWIIERIDSFDEQHRTVRYLCARLFRVPPVI